jgi:cytidine deaminase
VFHLEVQRQTVQHDDPRIQLALDRATEARRLAYAPYSRFHMGAAVVTDNGTVVPGALVENVSLGLAMCAERVALFAGVASDAGRPEVLALVARLTSGSLTWPCGACLQVAMELGGPDLLVAASNGKRLQVARLGDLAPNLPHKPEQPRPG